MVGVRRFERPTRASQTRCATWLRYTPTELLSAGAETGGYSRIRTSDVPKDSGVTARRIKPLCQVPVVNSLALRPLSHRPGSYRSRCALVWACPSPTHFFWPSSAPCAALPRLAESFRRSHRLRRPVLSIHGGPLPAPASCTARYHRALGDALSLAP